jgi:integrase
VARTFGRFIFVPRSHKGIYEHPPESGNWWVEWYDNRGRRHRQTVGRKRAAIEYKRKVTVLLKEIKRKLRPESALVDDGFLPGDDGAKRITVREYLKDCVPEYRQQKSWKDTKRYMEKWDYLIGELYLDEVSAKHAIRRRTARLEKGLKPATCNREVEFLRAVLNRALREGLLKQNPLSLLQDLPENNKRTRTLARPEEDRLGALMSPENFEVIAVAVDTGIRRDRLFNLPWTRIDLHGEWIDIKGAKAGSDRMIPMTRRVKAILERRFANRRGSWVFENSNGDKPMDANNFINREFRPALEAAEIEDLIFHDLRRTFGSRLANAGKGGRILSGLMGHKSPVTTDRYAHLDPSTFKAAISVLDREGEEYRGGLRVIKGPSIHL